MKATLHFCNAERSHYLRLTKALIEKYQERVFPVFDDIEREAEEASEEVYNSTEFPPDMDLGDVAEIAHDHGLKIYEDLDFVRKEVVGSSIAVLFHFWERQIKQFFVRGSRIYDFKKANNGKDVTDWSMRDVIECLKFFNFDVESQPFYRKLRNLSLLANAIKHGDGRSCDRLYKEAPEFFYKTEIPVRRPTVNLLEIDPIDFRNLSKAVVEFWEAMPERLESDEY